MSKQVVLVLGLLVSLVTIGLISGCARSPTPPPMSYHFHYDDDGRLAGWTDGNGQMVSYTFDDNGRATAICSTDGKITFAYDAHGNVTEAKEDALSLTYRYDAFNRLVEARYRHSPKERIQYEYDPLGRVATIKIMSVGGIEYEVHYEYDILGNLLAVDDGEGRIEYTHHPERRQIVRHLPNGITTIFTFSPLGELLSIRHVDASGRLIVAYEYEHDAAGNVIRVREVTLKGVKVIRYEWDLQGYLKALHLPDGSTERYEYDAMGNRIAKITATRTVRYEYDKYGRLIKAGNDTYRYDRAGNLTEAIENGRRIRFKWDAQGRLIEVRLPTEMVRYRYDWMGNLISRTQGKETTYSLPNPLAPIGFTLAEFDQTGNLKRAYLYGDVLLGCREANGQKRYFLEDGFSSVRLITDSSGQTVGRRDYSPFAELIYQSGERVGGFRTMGEWLDPFTGYSFISDRVYNPHIGRYIMPRFGVARRLRIDSFNSYAHACNVSYAFTAPRCNQTPRGKWVGAQIGVGDLLNDRRTHFDNALILGMGEGTTRIPNIVERWGGRFQFIVLTSTDNAFLDAIKYATNAACGASPRALNHVAVDIVYIHSGGATIGFHGIKGTVYLDPAFHDESATRGRGLVRDLTSWRLRPIGRHPGEIGVGIEFTPPRLGRFLRGVVKLFGNVLRGRRPFAEHGLAHQLDLIGGRPPKRYNEVWIYDMHKDEWHYYKMTEKGKWEFVEKRKEMPIGDFRRRDRCEPPFWHDGDGGGGGGGGFGNPFAQGGELHDPMKAVEQDLGGVELSASGRFIGEFGHIVGLVYDRSSDRLILIGDQDITLPPMDLSYFAVAEQLVSQGYGKVWFSLDPADPKNPRGKWMKCVWGPPGFPAEFLPGTPVGDVMFEADWVMKQYSFGVKVDEDGTVKPRMCRVPGFKDMFTLLFERFSGARRASWNRFWIVIGDVVMRRSGDAVVIEDVDVQVMTERMYATRQGLQSSGGKKDPEAEAFARFFEEHYDELAQEEPALAQLKGFGKVFALVKWLHAKGISVQMDSEWIKRSEYVQRITALSDMRSKTKRYRRGSALITETRTVHLFGGDEVKAHPVEEPDDGSVARLSQAVHATLRDRPSEVNMPVQVNRGTMMAVVLPLTSDGKQLWQKAKSRRTIERNGSTYHLGADGKVQYSEDVFGTQVHYHRNAQGKLTGFTAKSQDGWTVVATRQSGTVLDVTSPRGDTYRYIWDTDGYLSKVMVNGRPFARCSYDPMQRVARISYNGYTETLVYNQKDLLEKWIVEPTDGVSNGTCGSLTIAYNENRQVIHLQTDTGYRLDATYENGLVHSVRVGGAEVRFSWRDEERLASVRSANVRVNYTYQGENLRTISVQRGDAKAYVTFEKGLVKEAKNFSGGRWLCRYDQRDALIEVTDPTGAQGHYRYDADSRLIEVVLPGNGCIQYIYGQIPVKEQKGETAKSIQLLAVNYLPEGENASVRNDVRMWHTFPWRTAGFVGLGILLVLGGIWWWRRRQEMWW